MWLIVTCFCSWLYDRYSSQQDLYTMTLELAGKLPSFFRKFSHVFVKVSLRSFWSSSHRRGCSYKCTFHGMRCSKDIFSPMWIFSCGVAGFKSQKKGWSKFPICHSLQATHDSYEILFFPTRSFATHGENPISSSYSSFNSLVFENQFKKNSNLQLIIEPITTKLCNFD